MTTSFKIYRVHTPEKICLQIMSTPPIIPMQELGLISRSVQLVYSMLESTRSTRGWNSATITTTLSQTPSMVRTVTTLYVAIHDR